MYIFAWIKFSPYETNGSSSISHEMITTDLVCHTKLINEKSHDGDDLNVHAYIVGRGF